MPRQTMHLGNAGYSALVRSLWVVLLVPILVAACTRGSATDSKKTTQSGQTARPAQTTQPAQTTWLATQKTFSDKTITSEQVTYRVGDLKVVGLVCRPVAAGKRKVVLLAHAGFIGLGTDPHSKGSPCAQLARQGWAVVEPAYRGEDSSGGSVEVCNGEVDDATTMLDIALKQDWADPDKVGMMGFSHGGCVVLRALERGVSAKVAVVVSGVTDWAATDSYMARGFDAGGKDAGEQGTFVNLIERSIGGKPDAVPDAYKTRSPITAVGDLDKVHVPILILHGVADQLVPIGSLCEFAARGHFVSFHLDKKNATVTTDPKGCAAGTPTWQDGAAPGKDWPDERYFIAFDGIRHYGSGGPSQYPLVVAVADFVAAKMPAS